MTPVRCAIYTRKSSEEGLEQGFNSLDAQREACAAYILSQASEGWQLIEQVYDDGGISGGTLKRPALQQLLADVAAGKVDIIVVYKVDRLTRSLLDFAKLVEALDQADTSFVSITQSFNTTTSMGRLTLNMLLSFAQFEREVTAERIRDKLAASKAKGMWMGGVPPLGYLPKERTLAVDQLNAELIRCIYARYMKLGCVRLLADQLIDEGIRVPKRITGTGRELGGGFFSRGQLYAILKNPIYAGNIRHRDRVYAGNHLAIINQSTWDAVQRKLESKGVGRGRKRTITLHPLAGLLIDGDGEPLVLGHTRKGDRRYEYFITRSLHHRTSTSGIRVPAAEIEQVVASNLARLLQDPLELLEKAGLVVSPAALDRVMERLGTLGASCYNGQLHSATRLLSQVRILEEGIEIVVSAEAMAGILDLQSNSGEDEKVVHSCPIKLTRTGRAVRLVHDNGTVASAYRPDPALVRLLIQARTWWSILADGQRNIRSLSAQEGVTESYISRVVRLAMLSPRVVEAILAGRTRAEVNGKFLLRAAAIGADWQAQEKDLLTS